MMAFESTLTHLTMYPRFPPAITWDISPARHGQDPRIRFGLAGPKPNEVAMVLEDLTSYGKLRHHSIMACV
jgi:hypothetical protein